MKYLSDIKLVYNAINEINNLLKEEQAVINSANIDKIRGFYAQNPHMENAEGEIALLHSQYLHELGKVFSYWVELVFDKGYELINIGLALMKFFNGEGSPHITDICDDDDTVITYGVLKPNGSTLVIEWKEDAILLHVGGHPGEVKFGPYNDVFTEDFRTALGENWGTALVPILKPWLIKGESDDLPDLPEGKTLETLTGDDIRKMIEGPICDMIASLDDQANPEPTPPSPQVCEYNAEVGCDLCVYQMPDGRCWKNG